MRSKQKLTEAQISREPASIGDEAATLSIGEVAFAVFVSPSHLSRLFRARTNTTFLEYLTNVRVEAAKKLLADPRAKIYDIAPQVGYSDWKHFSRIFKEATGYQPSEFRQRIMTVPDDN